MNVNPASLDHALRAPDRMSIPKRWRRVRLADVADARLGKMLDAQKNRGRPHPYLRNPNVRWFEVDLTDLREMPFEEDEEEKFSIRDGDVLICEGGEAGRAAIWNGPDIGVKFQKAIHRVRPSAELFNRYLVHRLFYDYHSGGLLDYYTGATIAHLTGQDLTRYEFPLPPPDEQRRIAAILDQADEMRRKRREALRQLDVLAHVTYRTSFGDPVTNPKRLPSKTLGEIGVEMRYGPRFYNEAYTDDGIRIVRITDLSESGELDFDSMPRLAVSASELDEHKSHPGELLFARTGATVGKLTLIKGGDPICIPGAYFIRLRFPPEVDPTFAWYTMRSNSMQRIVFEQSRQSAQQNFSGPGLRRLPFIAPPLDLQHIFAARVAEIDALKAQHRAHLARLDALFASLQHRAFHGEL